VEVMAKPGGSYGVGDMSVQLAEKIRAAANVRVRTLAPAAATAGKKTGSEVSLALKRSTHKVIAMGASTGGTEALKSVLMEMPANSPGIVIVQHMPPRFTTAFANRLNGLCRVERAWRDHDRHGPGRRLGIARDEKGRGLHGGSG